MAPYLNSGECFDLCCAACLDPICGDAVQINDEHFHPSCAEPILAEIYEEERRDALIAATYEEPDQRMAAE